MCAITIRRLLRVITCVVLFVHENVENTKPYNTSVITCAVLCFHEHVENKTFNTNVDRKEEIDPEHIIQ